MTSLYDPSSPQIYPLDSTKIQNCLDESANQFA
jgi:hypothetical protein